MKCYVCAEEGKSTESVSMCIVCGMGLCMDHAIRQEIELWTGGYPFPAEKIEETLPRILCKYCAMALKKGEPKKG